MAENAGDNAVRSNDVVNFGDGGTQTFNGADYQVGGAQYDAELSGSRSAAMPMDAFPSASSLLAQMNGGSEGSLFSQQQQQMGPGTDGSSGRQRTPEEMQSVDRNSAEVQKMFPGAENQELRDAAYRYLMHRECVDDYSSSFKKDSEMLNKHAPGTTDKLEEIIRQRRQQGPAPGSKNCDLVS